ncbi:hypothetical protein RRG08_059860 [Elysia crispata]|uniref:Uncharacterized protein n=1 Tax=Elysia crispata TaxID=231223 RepID=A0AAE1DWE7_9GAST|nr:hypothetical protein RRG08_059860 [Elysia crispata]
MWKLTRSKPGGHSGKRAAIHEPPERLNGTIVPWPGFSFTHCSRPAADIDLCAKWEDRFMAPTLSTRSAPRFLVLPLIAALSLL